MTGWILTSTDPEMLLRMPAGATKTIGRTARADFIVDAALVSRVHCRLVADDDDQLTVEDLDSTNGTLRQRRARRSVGAANRRHAHDRARDVHGHAGLTTSACTP